MVEEFFNRLDALFVQFNTVETTSPTECVTWRGKLNESGYGTVQLRMHDGKRKHTTAHRASFMAYHRIIEITKYNNEGQKLEVSHLCHNNACIKPQHLRLESCQINQERRMCKNGKICIGHEPECIIINEFRFVFDKFQRYFKLNCTKDRPSLVFTRSRIVVICLGHKSRSNFGAQNAFFVVLVVTFRSRKLSIIIKFI